MPRLIFLFALTFFVARPSYVCAEAPLGYIEGPGSILFDLNGDGKKDTVTLHDTECASGGCAFTITDSKTHKVVGELFGSTIFILPARINGWLSLGVFARGGADGGKFITYVFDGKKYLEVSGVFVEGESARQFLRELMKAPKIG